MSEVITAKHAYNSGDLLTILPGFQKIYKETGKKVRFYQRLGLRGDYGHKHPHPVRDKEGYQVCMNEDMFNMMKPLIEFQEYVDSFEIWNGESVDFNMDMTRQNAQMPLPNGSIHHWVSLVFPQLECDLSQPWLKALDVDCNYFIINRTARYRNDYINYSFLKPHENQILFAGTTSEWERFNKENGLKTQYLWVENFLELATYIKNCRGFLGSQSFCWHIADALKIPRIVEVCQFYPNTFPTGANGYSFITQNALEWQFNKLLTTY